MNELLTPPGSVSTGTRGKHNVRCAMRQRLHSAIIIVFSRRIKPNCGFKTRGGIALPQLRRQIIGRPQDKSFSFRFSELALNLLRAHADEKESTIRELLQDSPNKIGIREMERRRRHRAHYIG
jgi:hypothetical protein